MNQSIYLTQESLLGYLGREKRGDTWKEMRVRSNVGLF